MGFSDKLANFIAVNRNSEDPLFGGLIPRREVFERGQPGVDRISAPVRRNSINPMSMSNDRQSVINHVLSQAQQQPNTAPLLNQSTKFGRLYSGPDPFAGRNVQFDFTEQELKAKNRALDIENKRVDQENSRFDRSASLAEQKHGLDVEKFGHELDIDKDKQEIEHRKQALDEWVKHNPEGEVKTLEDGKIVLIDKRTGKSIDTKLKADHLTEKEKLKLQHDYRTEEIRERDKLQEDNIKATDKINPSQQRIAEDDAASELLNDERYSWLEKEGIVTKDKSGNLKINHPTKGYYGKSIEEAKGTVKSFQDELKKNANDRMNKFTNRSSKADSSGMVDMVAPDGGRLQVPADKVEEMKKHGAKVAGK